MLNLLLAVCRSLRKLSSYGGRSSSSAVWSSSFSFDDPGPLQRFDLRQCPALGEGGGGHEGTTDFSGRQG